MSLRGFHWNGRLSALARDGLPRSLISALESEERRAAGGVSERHGLEGRELRAGRLGMGRCTDGIAATSEGLALNSWWR